MTVRLWWARLVKGKVLGVAATVAVFFLLLCGCTVGTSSTVISLTRPDGSIVAVPLSGPLYSQKAERIAREIRALDTAIASRNVAAKSESEAAMLAVAVEFRNDALRELDLALRVAQNTSAGQLDPSIVGKAERYSSVADEVLSSPVPGTLKVGTQISTSVPNATLHYKSKGKYDAESGSWTSYTEGDRLNIGIYMFLIESSDPVANGYTEPVLVTSDPTKKRLIPRLGVNR